MVRITPAYAGKSCPTLSDDGHNRDHPRLRGEKPLSNYMCDVTLGSPPPTRGKGDTVNQSVQVLGITPAYAGKRLRFPLDQVHIQDHPRLRGEKVRSTEDAYRLLGSPPPTRGKGCVSHNKTSVPRITLAYAGKRKAYRAHD